MTNSPKNIAQVKTSNAQNTQRLNDEPRDTDGAPYGPINAVGSQLDGPFVDPVKKVDLLRINQLHLGLGS